MTATSERPNLAARMGSWSAQHRKTAIWGWLAFVVVAFGLGGAVGMHTADNAHLGVGESGRADLTIDAAFPKSADEMVLVQSATENADSIPFRAAVGDAEYRLSQLPYVHSMESPYEAANAGQISRDGHSALVQFKIAGDQNTAKDRAATTLQTVDAVQAAHPQVTVGEFGDASSNNQVSNSINNDFKTALITSLPVTLVILLVAFGALVAAGLPLLLGLTAVIATIGLIGPISHIGSGVDESITEVILLIGLAVGVDYSMFYLRREREERAAGRSEQASLAAAAATSGRAVMVSGFTVMIAMAGMYLAGASTFQSFATGTILVVAVAVIGSLTVLPAVLAWLGDRVEKGRIPFLGRRRWGAGESRVWSRVLNPALRHPVVSVLVAGGFLVFLAIPAFHLHTASPGVETLPQDLGVIKTYNRIEAAFPGGPIPAEVVISAQDVRSPEVIKAVNDLEARATASPNFEQPITTSISPDRTVQKVDIPVVGDGTDPKSTAALAQLRDELIPATIGQVPGASADVTGYTAQSTDFNDTMKSHAPLVFIFVLSAAFLLLLFTFRSLVIPVKAIILNLLSVGAAYGVMVWIFQEGHLESLLGFKSNGAIVSWMPLFLFVVLFGLSMDYHVFILTRIREAFDRGRRTEDAVAHGIKTTAGVVTSAAVVMISVFAIFATLSLLIFKQLGIGLAVAVLIDATIIRGVLLPATMKLLGDWNWYLPRWLEWLPHVGPSDGAVVRQLMEEPVGGAGQTNRRLRPPRQGLEIKPMTVGSKSQGAVASGFEEVRAAFDRNFAEGREIGAAVAAYWRGEKVVDLWGGRRTPTRDEPWNEDTMVVVNSTTKGLAAMTLAVANSRGWIDYDAPVAQYWPEFAQNGKAEISVRQVLSHEAGLVFIDPPLRAEDLSDLDHVARVLAAQKPSWKPGTRHGYHAMSIGLYMQELIRRVDSQHRTLGRFFHEEIAVPLDVDFYIGLPREVSDERLAKTPPFSPMRAVRALGGTPAAFVIRLMWPRSLLRRSLLFADIDFNDRRWLEIELPAGNGVGTARGIARAYSAFAEGGEELGITHETLASLTAPHDIHHPKDEVMGIDSSYSLGFLKPGSELSFGSSQQAFGTPGAGGSFGFADPAARLGFAYVMNNMGYYLLDPRERALRDAVYRSIQRLSASRRGTPSKQLGPVE